jgi:hypothetical protein
MSIAVAVLVITSSSSAFGQSPLPTADEVVAQMTLRNTERQSLLGQYTGMRRYIFENGGMGKHAEIVVRITGDSEGSKRFEVVREEGWQPANKHVLEQLLNSEEETSQSPENERVRLAPANYYFRFEGVDQIEGRPAFVLDASPKRPDKYLFAGRIWVDAEDYAVARIEGRPAKNPSFWARNVHFVQTYKKNGPLWFPARTESVSQALVFGKTDVSIDYFDYGPAASDVGNNQSVGAVTTGAESQRGSADLLPPAGRLAN